MEEVVREDLAVLVHLLVVAVEVVDTLEGVDLTLQEEAVVPAILITLLLAPLASIQGMDMRLLTIFLHRLSILQLHQVRCRRLSRRPLLLQLLPLLHLRNQLLYRVLLQQLFQRPHRPKFPLLYQPKLHLWVLQ